MKNKGFPHYFITVSLIFPIKFEISHNKKKTRLSVSSYSATLLHMEDRIEFMSIKNTTLSS